MCFNVKTQESSCIRISHSDYHFGALNGEIIALHVKVVILQPYLRGVLTELEPRQFFLVRPPDLKTWIPTELR